jgi:hypothetical protein
VEVDVKVEAADMCAAEEGHIAGELVHEQNWQIAAQPDPLQPVALEMLIVAGS